MMNALQNAPDGTDGPTATRLKDMSRADIAAQWDGAILLPRYARSIAFVPFAIDGPDDTTWGLRSIIRLMPQTYDARATQPY